MTLQLPHTYLYTTQYHMLLIALVCTYVRKYVGIYAQLAAADVHAGYCSKTKTYQFAGILYVPIHSSVRP